MPYRRSAGAWNRHPPVSDGIIMLLVYRRCFIDDDRLDYDETPASQ